MLADLFNRYCRYRLSQCEPKEADCFEKAVRLAFILNSEPVLFELGPTAQKRRWLARLASKFK